MAALKQYPEYVADIEEHIRRARVQRAAVLGHLIGTGIAATWEALRRLLPHPGERAPRPAGTPLVVKARLATPART